MHSLSECPTPAQERLGSFTRSVPAYFHHYTMLQPRIASREASLNSLAIALNNLALCSRHAPKRQQPQLIFSRNASHAAQGRANGPKDSAGRRLGAKKTASQYVIPGNIIFKQRGKSCNYTEVVLSAEACCASKKRY